jgi:hypothetical protein
MTQRTTTLRRAAVVVTGLLATATLGACGSDSDDDPDNPLDGTVPDIGSVVDDVEDEIDDEMDDMESPGTTGG